MPANSNMESASDESERNAEVHDPALIQEYQEAVERGNQAAEAGQVEPGAEGFIDIAQGGEN